MVNAVGFQRRTDDQVKFNWGNLQQSAKRSLSAALKQSKLTDGGPPPKPPTAAKEKIIVMMKDRISGSLLGALSLLCPPRQV